MSSGRLAWVIVSLLWLVSLAVLLYVPDQQSFFYIIAPFAVAFVSYVYLLRAGKKVPLRWMLALAVLARVLAIPAFPQLSDDIYRFVWDGRLLAQGQNPFDHLPSYYLSLEKPLAGIDESLYGQLNSPAYFTVYPPVAQAVFTLGAWLFPRSLLGHTLIIKLFLLLCSLGTISLLPGLLARLGISPHRAGIYLLNPLVIVEVLGNLHFEGAMVFFLLLALWKLSDGKWIQSAVALSLSVAAKLLPLMFLPFLIRRLGWRRSIKYFCIMGVALLLFFAPLFSSTFIESFTSSLDLYFRRFEFNASVYYLMRWVGYQVTGYNQIALIGPVLALCTLSGILIVALLDVGQPVRAKVYQPFELPLTQFLFAITLYLLLTPTVHPWYVCLPLFLCLFTPYRYPVVWSGLIMLTYINYSYEVYRENLGLIALEYILLYAYIIWEYTAGNKKPGCYLIPGR